jgi:glucose/arabinose dehydrogenase
MIKYLFFSLFAAFICLSFVQIKENKNAVNEYAKKQLADSGKAAINYKNLCGSCHGEKMDAFVDRTWKHGSTTDNLFKGIKQGYTDKGMPAFESIMPDDQIAALSDYIAGGINRLKQYNFGTALPTSNVFTSEDQNIKLDTIVKGVASPWGFTFLPSGEILMTEKSGKIYRVGKDKSMHLISGVPEVLAEGQGGLLDIILHPNFKKNQLIYISYSAVKREDGATLGTTAIMCAKLNGDKLEEQKVIFEALPYSKTRHHYGSRLVFGKDGFLYFSVGERGNEKVNPQSLTNDLGKIHRITDEGRVPADNPFVNTPGAKPTIFGFGNRNPQGLLLNNSNGQIWEIEHGPRGGDEINIIGAGKNYGWPVICYGINYDTKIISDKTSMEGMEEPLHYWLPSIAPSGMAFVEGNRYTGWKGDLMVGSLRFKYLNRCKIKNGKVVGEELLLKNIGRVRDVIMGPDGYLYISVENPGFIFKLLPV